MTRKSKAPKLHPTTNVVESSDSTLDAVNIEPKVHTNSGRLTLRKKVSQDKRVIVRRSGRLQNLVPPTPIQMIEVVAEEIDLIESEKEDEPHVEQYTPEQIAGEKSFTEKLSYLFQNVEELKAKAMERRPPTEDPCTDITYKNLYIDSQKKIEALKDENLQLAKKLEFALGKVEAFEKVADAMESLKEVILGLVSNLGKAPGAVRDLSSQAASGRFAPPDTEPKAPPAKKKKLGKGNTNSTFTGAS